MTEEPRKLRLRDIEKLENTGLALPYGRLIDADTQVDDGECCNISLCVCVDSSTVCVAADTISNDICMFGFTFACTDDSTACNDGSTGCVGQQATACNDSNTACVADSVDKSTW